MSDSSPDNSGFDRFKFTYFVKFLSNHNVFSIVIASILSERLSELINSCIDNLIMPILNRDANNDGIEDIKNIEDYEITIYNTKFKIGRIITSLLRFLIITYIIFIIFKITQKKELIKNT